MWQLTDAWACRFQISNPITTAEVDRNFANLYSRWHENGARPEQTDGKLAFQRLRRPFLRHKIDARNDLMRHLRINDVTRRSHPPLTTESVGNSLALPDVPKRATSRVLGRFIRPSWLRNSITEKHFTTKNPGLIFRTPSSPGSEHFPALNDFTLIEKATRNSSGMSHRVSYSGI